MTSPRRRAALPALLLVLATAAPSTAAVFRAGQPVMGTVLQVTVIAADADQARTAAEAAIDEARRWDDILTTWRPEGELARLNLRAGTGPVRLSPDLSAALRTMQRYAGATDGAFDPAVGPLVDLWRGPQPPRPMPAALTQHHVAEALRLDRDTATLAAGAKLDAGGIGKGMALDAAAALLRRRGVQAAYLDFGGSSQVAIGAPPDAPDGWRVAVSGLQPNQLIGVLSLRDAALSTSRAASGPTAAGPIIDPRSGQPVASPRLTTVRAADATAAEAWSKAVIIGGRATLPRARAAGMEVLLEDSQGIERTAGFALGSDATH